MGFLTSETQVAYDNFLTSVLNTDNLTDNLNPQFCKRNNTKAVIMNIWMGRGQGLSIWT